MSIRTRRREKMAVLAEEAFKDHVITRGEKEWLCRRPGTGAFHFHVAVIGDTHAVITGDLGSIVWSPHRDAKAFLRTHGAQPNYRISCDYPMEKVCGGAMREFSPDEAREVLRDTAALPAEDRGFEPSLVRELWDGETQHSWVSACISAGDDDPSLCEDFTAHMLWMWHAARCWARLVDEAEADDVAWAARRDAEVVS